MRYRQDNDLSGRTRDWLVSGDRSKFKNEEAGDDGSNQLDQSVLGVRLPRYDGFAFTPS